MDHILEEAKKTDECQMALTDELDSYTVSRFRPSASRLSGRFLATNRKAFHRKQMRLIVNEYFNKEGGDDEPTEPLLSQQTAFPSQTLARTLDEYREHFKKKTDDFKAALNYELETYFQSRFRRSATGRGAQFFANQQLFHREQMLLLIDEFFNTEEDDLPTFPSPAVLSVNQLDVPSNQVETTSASQSISPVTPNDQPQLVKSGVVQVKEAPIEKDNSTQRQEVDAPNTIENIVIVSITEQELSDCEADSDCGCDDCMAYKGRVQTGSVMVSANANEELSTAGNGSEMTNNHHIDEANNSLLNQEKDQVDEGVAQMQTDAQQQATVPIDINANNEQVNNSVNNNFEIQFESQDMDFDDGFDEQVDAEPIIDEAFPTDDLVSRPSTSSGRQSTRSKKSVNYAVPDEDSDDEYLPANRNRKRTIRLAGELSTHKRVAVEPVVVADDDVEEEEEDVETESVRLSVIVHHLNCPETGCTEEFPDKAQLNEHLLGKHQISEFRCKVKDCGLSFVAQSQLTDHHHKLAHRNLKDWPCAQCETIRKSYKSLSLHFWQYHEEGEFQCSADKCDFTGKTHVEVYIHQYTHKARKYECTFAGCTASFKKNSTLTVHQRIHSGLKFHCKWSECDYSSGHRGNVNIHVRTVHFGLPATKKAQKEQNVIDARDAGEFIEKNPTK